MIEELIFLDHNDISKVSHCKYCGQELVPHIEFDESSGKIQYTQWKLCPTQNILFKIKTLNDMKALHEFTNKAIAGMPLFI